jgi:hypothetical protein
VEIPGLKKIKEIAAGYNHALALASDGTVWTWGDNINGQIGDGTLAVRRNAAQLSGLNNVKEIAAGRNHSLALKTDGTVWAWGYNGFGQLGDNTTTNRLVPVQTAGIFDVTAIAGGTYHSLAVRTDGTVWSWGFNAYGQLGDESITNRTQAVLVRGIRGATSVAAGSAHSVAMSADGTVWTWGGNTAGQLGDGSFKNHSLPAVVAGFSSGSSFTDTVGHWAEATIGAASEKGYADGYPDGTFKPEGIVTRAEFAKLTAAAVKLPTGQEAGQAWYQPYVNALLQAGYYGSNDTEAPWNEPITRIEMAKVAVRATSKELQAPNTAVNDSFAMLTSVKKGILQGLDNGRLAPQETTTRAQAVTIVERILMLNNGGTLSVDELALINAQAQ